MVILSRGHKKTTTNHPDTLVFQRWTLGARCHNDVVIVMAQDVQRMAVATSDVQGHYDIES